MMNKILSVIVPVYNVENYLHKCLDSIIKQTYTNLEIIIVDDGSTDSSPKICDDYAEKDSRIKVIHQKNAGVSVARNKGIEVSTGAYITFVDSDDWLESSMYEIMSDSAKEAGYPDVLMCDYIKLKGENVYELSTELRQGFYSKSQIVSEIYPTLIVTEEFGRIPIIAVWSCFFKRSLLLENKIIFDASLMYSEDYLFMAEIMTKANFFYYLKEKYLYNYLHYEESRSKKYQPDWWENLLHLNSELKKLLKDNKDYDFSTQLKLQLVHSALFVFASIKKNRSINFISKVKEIQKILNQDELVEAFSDLSFEKMHFNLKIVLYLLKYRMAFAFALYRELISSFRNA